MMDQSAPTEDYLVYKAQAARFAALADAHGVESLAVSYLRIAAVFRRLADQAEVGNGERSVPFRKPEHSEEAELAKAKEKIEAGKRRIDEQMHRLAKLRALGCDTRLAEDVLDGLLASLHQWKVHRHAIEAALGRIRSATVAAGEACSRRRITTR